MAAFTVGTAVAKTISRGLIRPEAVTPVVILAALIGAIVWNLITWYYGLPSSSSQALLGGYAGAAVSNAGLSSLIGSGWIKPLAAIVVPPLLGLTLGLTLYVSLAWLLRDRNAPGLDKLFRRLQLVSAALYSLSHAPTTPRRPWALL